MAKPKLVKTSSAKYMHELAASYKLPQSFLMETMKGIELRALQGSYFMNSPDGTFELIKQLTEELEKEGFKCTMTTPDEGEDDDHYWVKITW